MYFHLSFDMYFVVSLLIDLLVDVLLSVCLSFFLYSGLSVRLTFCLSFFLDCLSFAISVFRSVVLPFYLSVCIYVCRSFLIRVYYIYIYSY